MTIHCVVDCIFAEIILTYMKKIILLSLMIIGFWSCKSTAPTSAVSNKADYEAQKILKGSWVMTSVSYPSSEFIKVNAFQLADAKCFEGSNWKFVANNNSGEMSMSKTGCTSFSSPIKWYINKEGQFVLKLVNAGEKAKKVRDGYVMTFVPQESGNFQLVDKINVGNKPTDVVFQFEKAK